MLKAEKREQSKRKREALKRDRYRCVLTGTIHVSEYDAHENDYPDADPEYLVPAHILPFSLNNAKNDIERDRSSAVWSMISLFSGIAVDDLNGSKINRIENIMMLTTSAHEFFGKLDIWLEAVDLENEPNRYKLKKARRALHSVPENTVNELVNHSGDPELRAPDPRYIQLHAACAKIAHASGADKFINNFLDDYEDLETLGADRSSYELLGQALSLAAVPKPVRN